MIVIALVLALSTLVVGVAAALLVRLLPTVRLQLIALAFLAVTLPLAAVLMSGWVMFHMHADVKILAVSAASALSAVIGALLVARWVIRPLEAVRAASRELAKGELETRAPALSRPTELAELSASFNEMAASLEEIFDARRQLVAWASHDLRTPVAAIQAMVEAVDDGLARPEEYLPALREQVRTLSRLIDDLFELACIDAGALTLDLQRTKLADVVQTCLRTVDAQARVRRVKLVARVVEETPEVDAAPDKLERILLNLLTNALRHTPADGSVAVLVSPEIAGVQVAVEDTGNGVEPESVERIFDHFWKEDVARSRDGGTGAGLGLAIAKGLVEAHGGAIWAERRAGGGARVVFTLPAAWACSDVQTSPG